MSTIAKFGETLNIFIPIHSEAPQGSPCDVPALTHDSIQILSQFLNTVGSFSSVTREALYSTNPSRSGRIVAKDLSPSDYRQVPLIKWNVIESVADHRLRMGELTESGLLGEEEGRKQLGLRGKLSDEQQTVRNRVKLKEAEAQERLADAQNTMAEQRPPSLTNPTSEVSERRTPSDVRDRVQRGR